MRHDDGDIIVYILGIVMLSMIFVWAMEMIT